MRLRIAGRARSAPATLGRLFHVLPHYETATGTIGVQRAPSTRGPSDPTPLAPQEAAVFATYGLFDEWICDYACVLVSDAYRLGEYVGDSVWVSGPLRRVIGGMPVMEVTHLEMLKLKWMR
jgi:hypothetical protein